MIKPKSYYVARNIWAYISKYPHSTTAQIAGAQSQYSRAEIERALDDLVVAGYIQWQWTSGARNVRDYTPVVPFVVQAPTWQGVL